MKNYRVIFYNYNYQVFANNVKHAIVKCLAKYHMPSGFDLHEGFQGNCKLGKKLYSNKN